VSASDTEDDLALQTNHVGDLAHGDDDEQVLCAHVDHSEKVQ
jgi:hypothetical protein